MMEQATGRRMQLGTMPSMRADAPGGQPRFRDLRAMAEAAEAMGLDSFWLADHVIFRAPSGENIGTWEGFTFLSALAAATSRIQLGPLVACTSFRNPALLAKMADSLDEISDRRFILGLGSGWNEPEYTMFDYPFDHRVSRFEEALQVIAPMLKGETVTFHGAYYHAENAVLDPHGPSPAGPPLWIGGTKPRMLRLTARYADAYNTDMVTSVTRVQELAALIHTACVEVGRDPDTLALTSFVNVTVLAPGEHAEPNATGIIGTPEEVAAGLREFEAAGVTHIVLRFTSPGVAGIERFAPVLALLDR